MPAFGFTKITKYCIMSEAARLAKAAATPLNNRIGPAGSSAGPRIVGEMPVRSGHGCQTGQEFLRSSNARTLGRWWA